MADAQFVHIERVHYLDELPEEDFLKMTEVFRGLLPEIEIPPEGGISRGAEAHCASSLPKTGELSNII